MVNTHVDASGTAATIVVRPNQSLSWRGNVLVLASLGAVMFTIATGFALFGLWLVLPFAGLELAAVATVLYLTCRRLARSEVICVSPDGVSIQAGRNRPESRWQLQRPWARVDLREGATRSHPRRLILRSRGAAIEVGACLTEDERTRLARDLRRLLAGQAPAR